MTCKSLRFSVLFLFSIVIVSLLSSCQKFEGDQTVPAYIRIDSIIIKTNYEEEGAPSSNVTDAWVYVNDQAIGAYELPAVFPVLAKGLTEIRIDPGIKLNGISGLRTPYPFYQPIVQQVYLQEGIEVNLGNDTLFFEGDVVPYTTTTRYYDNLEFVWLEDFEDPSLSLDSTSKSRTDITRTSPANSPEAFLADYSKYSGLMILTQDIYLIDVATNVGNQDGYVLPKVGEPVFLEFDYKNNNLFTAGLYVNEQAQIIQHPVLNINPSSGWNKIYVNLSPAVSSNTAALDFNVFFGALIESDVDEARILIDNIKLIHRKQ